MADREVPPVTVTGRREAPEAEVAMRVEGRDYLGWTSLRISRAMDRMATDFEVQVAERWQGLAEAWPIRPFSPVEFRLGGELALTGYVDCYLPTLDARSHAVRILGRSRTEDLIDCTPEIPGGEYRGARLDAIARAVCAPFGIGVVVEADVGAAFDVATLERTDTAFEFLETQARLRGVLLTDDEQGRLVITRTGEKRAAGSLEQGVNILRAHAELNVSKRFSRYFILGQQGSVSAWQGVNPIQGEAQPQGGGAQPGIIARADDPAVPRYRPRAMKAEAALTPAEAQQRVRWQAAYAAGRSTRLRATVAGWRQEDGALWRINRLIRCKVPLMQLDRDMLIVGVTFNLGKDGRTTELDLGPPEGFTPDPGQVRRHKHAGAGGNPWGDVVRIPGR